MYTYLDLQDNRSICWVKILNEAILFAGSRESGFDIRSISYNGFLTYRY